MDGAREQRAHCTCRIVVGDGKTSGECASLVCTGWCASANPCRAADGRPAGLTASRAHLQSPGRMTTSSRRSESSWRAASRRCHDDTIIDDGQTLQLNAHLSITDARSAKSPDMIISQLSMLHTHSHPAMSHRFGAHINTA